MLNNDRRRIELMNGMLMSLPGTPIIYYGDEIGMGDNIILGDRNGVRTPMQWSGGMEQRLFYRGAGALVRSLIQDPVYGYPAVNVLSQRESEHSLLRWMQRIITVRRSTAVFGRGSIEFLYPANHRILAYLRRLGNEAVLVVNNLSSTCASCRTGFAALQGKYPDRDVWQQYISACGRPALSADDGALPVLLVSAAANLSECGQGKRCNMTRAPTRARGGTSNGDEIGRGELSYG